MNILHNIDINSIEEKIISVDAFKTEYEEWLNSSGLLHKKSKKEISESLFSSNIWILYDEKNQIYHNIPFDTLIECNFRKIINNDDITIFKCWLVEVLREGCTPGRLRQRLNAVESFIKYTENFNQEVVNGIKGNAIHTFLEKETNPQRASSYIFEYIDFLDRKGLTEDVHLSILGTLRRLKLNQAYDSRQLPKTSDILAFDYYLKRFFSEQHNENLVNFYKPLLLWWKITMIIPMRASEFAFELKRDCLISKGEGYYLSINRIKVDSKSKRKGHIPLLNKIGISKDIHDSISDYIKCTDFDTTSKTLISYKAMKQFRNDYILNNSDTPIKIGFEYGDTVKLGSEFGKKLYEDQFNRATLTLLINSFYRDVISKYYNHTGIEKRLLPGDTRHLAFTNLLIQGISPIEIAMLGGHTTLEAQSSYTGHIQYYIDSEILDFMGTRNIQTSISDRNLIKIISSKSEICPRLITDCSPTEDGIGYCTLDLKTDTTLCDDVTCCIFCEKWWCEPSNENYIKAKKYLEVSQLAPLQQAIQEEEAFLFNLLAQAKTINMAGLLELDSDDESMIIQSRLKLKSDADKMISLKKSLLEMFNVDTSNGDTEGNLIWEDLEKKLMKKK